MRIYSQRQTKIRQIQDDILNLSTTLTRLNIQVDDLLSLEEASDSDATIPEKSLIGSHVNPITAPHKDVKGVILSLTDYFVTIQPNNKTLKPFRKARRLLQLLH